MTETTEKVLLQDPLSQDIVDVVERPAQTTCSRCPVCGSNNRKREQKLIDMMFEIAIRTQTGDIKCADREATAAYVETQLRANGFWTRPRGLSWGVLQ